MKQRIYKYDNIKAFLILLVVIGHLTTDYVGTAHAVRWFTLWIYSFHMPAFIFVSGLMHKKYITDKQAAAGEKGNTKIRWDKVIGFLLCAYGLKIFLQVFRTAIGQHPNFDWLKEPGIPWYLIVMAEYEILLYILRIADTKKKEYTVLGIAVAVSAIIGYFPAIGDLLCLSRMINFAPIFLLGYYIDTAKLTELSERTWAKTISAVVIIASIIACYVGPWTAYRLRKYFTGRRSYEFLEEFFPGTFSYAWLIRLGVWAVAILVTLAVIIIIPNKNLGYASIIGARSLSVYFWHRPFCYWLNGLGVFQSITKMCGSITVALVVYVLIGIAMTALFGLEIFIHPAKDLQTLGVKIANIGKKKEV